MPLEPAWLVVLVLATLLFVVVAGRGWSRFRRRRKLRNQVLDAGRSERAAQRFLKSEGYEIEAVQPTVEWTLWVDGVPLLVRLRADLLVGRGGRRYVADVKLGGRASKITTVATRRQLLEYRLAYDVDGVLLIDMARGAIQEIEFDLASDQTRAA